MQNRVLAHYRILDKLGEGGMGSVWLAEDTRLGRSVAIKLLPPDFAADSERLDRFEREARVLAALSHPNIAGLFGLEEDDGQRFLVMELARGETLEQRLRRGPMLAEDAARVALDIARALEAAHDRGIVHRDLKPANVVLDPNDQVKVLDFGLAKAVHAEHVRHGSTELSSTQLDRSPTVLLNESDSGTLAPTGVADGRATSGSGTQAKAASDHELTQVGMLMGTASYMSPEQARAKPVDRRADVWAFGCVLFEMLSAQRAFTGSTLRDVLDAIVHAEPDWNALPPQTPVALQEVIARCLRKNIDQRQQSVGDARVLLQEWLDNPEGSGTTLTRLSPRRARALPRLLGVAAAVAALMLGLGWPRGSVDSAPFVQRWSATVADRPLAGSTPAVAVAPGGARVAVSVFDPVSLNGELLVREISRFEPTPLVNGYRFDAPMFPFFAPDGTRLGYMTGRIMWRTSISGESPSRIAELPNEIQGADWGEDDRIVVSVEAHRIAILPASGGELEEIYATNPDAEAHEDVLYPTWLPGQDAILITDVRGEERGISVLRLGESKLRPLGVAGERARFLSSGHLALLRAGTLFVVPFDLDRLEVTGEPAPMVRGIRRLSSGHAGHAGQFDVSADGTLVYQLESSTARDLPLVRAAENGGAEVLWQTEDYLLEPDVAPDGRSLLVTRGAGSEWDVWRFDFESGTPTRMTFEPGSEGRTVWAPDSQRFVYTKTTDVGVGVFSLAVDGRGEPEAVLEPGRFWYPVARAWHPDGRRLLFSARGGLHLLDLETGDVEAFFEHHQYSPFEATFSPNGRYVAYVSNEPGYIAIMLRATDGTGRWQITDRLARQPVWSADGTELFFRTDDGLEKVTIDTSSVPRWGRPERLFDLFRGETMLSVDRNQFLDYDVTPDGRFVMNSRANDQPVNHTELHFVSGWSAEVRAAAP